MANELDSRDFAIMQELDANCRSPLSQIAKKAKLSKSAVAARIQKLESNNFIDGYYAVIDSSRLGYSSFRVYLKFFKTSPQTEEKIIHWLRNDPRVWWLGVTQGFWNIGFVVGVKDLYDFKNFWFDFTGRFRKNISEYTITPYFKLRYYHFDYLSEQKNTANRAAEVVGEGPKIKIDTTDYKLLSFLSTNANLSLVEIAKHTKLSTAVVKYRIKHLLRKGIIQNFRAIINAPKLGYSLYKIDFVLDDTTKRTELRSFVETFPSLVYVDETIGGADFEAEFHLRSEQQLEELLTKIKSRFYNSIRETSHIVYSKVLKYSRLPTSI